METADSRRPVEGILSLDRNVLLHGVLSYLTLLHDVVAFASTCRELSRLVYRQSRLWGQERSAFECQAPMKMCMVKKCVGCGRPRIAPATALHLLARAPIRHLSVHVPFQHFVRVASAIHKRKTVVDLCVKFAAFDYKLPLPQFLVQNSIATSVKESEYLANDDNDDEYDSSVNGTIDGNVFLKNITFFGWPSTGLDFNLDMLRYCEDILSAIGGSSQSIQFYDSSPRGILWRLTSVCPKLEEILVEGDQSRAGATLSSSALTTLRLSQTSARLDMDSLKTPNLSLFEYLDDMNPQRHCNEMVFKNFHDVYTFVRAIPPNIKDFGIRISSSHADDVLNAITGHLHNLESLRLQLPEVNRYADYPFMSWDGDDGPVQEIHHSNITYFTAEQMTMLKTACPRLISIEISNTCISLHPAALLALGELDKLRRIKLLYSEELAQILPQFLSISKQMEEVTFFEDVSIGSGRWMTIDNKIARVSDLFPSVLIHLIHEEMEE